MKLLRLAGLSLGLLGFGAMASAVPQYVNGELLLKVKEGMESSIPIGVASVGATKLEAYPQIRWIRVRYASSKTLSKAISEFKRMNWVERVDKNLFRNWTALTNDPLIGQQWVVQRINLPLAWDWDIGNDQVKLAILDSGFEVAHQDLAGKFLPGWDTVDNDADVTDTAGIGHGTHVAGIAAASTNNATGIAGVGYNCKILPLRVGGFGIATSDLIEGIIWATDNDADVINMSLGGPSPQAIEQDAINYANDGNVFVCASAGNHGTTQKLYPAAYNGVMAIASSDPDDTRSGFSAYGNWVHVAAPGSQILSSVMGGGYQAWDGTSMSCPVVAGLAGLVWSRGGDNQSWTRVFDIIKDNCAPVPGNYTIHGRVDALQAVLATTVIATTSMQVTSVSMFTGTSEFGSLADLESEDGNFYGVLTSVQGRQGSLGGIEMTAVLDRPLSELFDFRMNFTVKSSAKCTGMMWLWNVNQSRWDFIKAFPVQTTNTDAVLKVKQMNKYVDTNDEVRIRLRGHIAAGRPGGATPFTFLTDFATMQASYEVIPP